MEDTSASRAAQGHLSGVTTMALLFEKGGAAQPIQITAHQRPSEAIESMVTMVAENPASRSGAIATTAEDDAEALRLVQSMVTALEPGQVIVTLPAVELSRNLLDSNFRFELVGNFPIGRDGGHERLFIVSHPQLASATSIASAKAAIEIESPPRDIFVGRSRELEDIARRLQLARMATVVGPPGIGKSALIRRYVDEHGEEYSDGVHIADFDSIIHPAVVGPMLMQLVGAVRLPGETSIEAIANHLHDRQALLVLDNVDRVMPEVRRVVSTVLNNAPQVAVLVGSGRALRMTGEARIKLEGLEYPVGVEDWRAIADFDSVALFVDRAQMVDPSFRLTPENAFSVSRLCLRLDGIPLALELAAFRINILTPHQILNRLDHRFVLLEDESEDRPDRHRTLRAMVEWGQEQLRPESRVLLRRLSIFAGAFSVDDAIAVAADSRILVESHIYGAFEELVECSMLTPSNVSGPQKRFYLSETVQMFALEQLRKYDESASTNERYRSWCRTLVTEAQAGMNGPEQVSWLLTIDAVYEDICRLIDHFAKSPSGLAEALQTLISIQDYFYHRNYHAEGLRIATRLLKLPRVKSQPNFARVKNMSAILTLKLGEIEEARRLAIGAYLLARKRGDRFMMAASRGTLALCAMSNGRSQFALRHYVATSNYYREVGDTNRLTSQLVGAIGLSEGEHNLERAMQYAEEAISLLRRHKNPNLRALLDQNLSHIYLKLGHYKSSLRHATLAGRQFLLTGNRESTAMCLRNAAYALTRLGEIEDAAPILGEAFRIEKLGDSPERWRRSPNRAAAEELYRELQSALGERFQILIASGNSAGTEEVLSHIALKYSI